MSDSLTELVAWAGQKGNATEDLIVLGITGAACLSSLVKVLRR
jgi:hypothetical protein